MPIAPDMQNPITEVCAEGLYGRSSKEEIAALTGVAEWQGWHLTEPKAREVFRDRARRFLAGDTSVLPWSWPIGYVV